MTIGQFVGFVLLLVLVYVVYNMWWVDQKREDWIEKFHKNTYANDGELDTSLPGEEEQKEETSVNGWVQ